MEKRLQIEVEVTRTVKNSEGRDCDAIFTLSLPYGIPFDVAKDVIAEMKADIDAMAEKADAAKKAQEAAAPAVEEKKE